MCKKSENKLEGISFRIPTSIVCASDLTIELKRNISERKSQNFL